MRLPMNTSLATLKPSGIRRINALAAQHPGCIALALGEPDFPTPDVISAEVTASLDRGDTHYPPNNGRPALREALSAYMGDAGLAFSADEVILTDGATEALSATFMAMLNPGDEVIIPTPAFGLYESIVVANHAKRSFWIRSLRNFRLTRMRFAPVCPRRPRPSLSARPITPRAAFSTRHRSTPWRA